MVEYPVYGAPGGGDIIDLGDPLRCEQLPRPTTPDN